MMNETKWKILLSILIMAFIICMLFIVVGVDLVHRNQSSIINSTVVVSDSSHSLQLLKFKDYIVRYKYLERTAPCNDKVQVVIMIPSRPSAVANRHAIRHSWLKDTDSTMAHRFVIGYTPDERVRGFTQNEASKFHDLIIADFVDTYSNLTLKANIIMQWQQTYCSGAQYLLKSDDDTIVDLQRMKYLISTKYDKLSEIFNKTVIFGRMATNEAASTIRDKNSKWFVPYSAWFKPRFPDFCNGASCLYTRNAVRVLLKESKHHFFITPDDVFFSGIVAEAAGVARIDQGQHFIYGSGVELYESCDANGVPEKTFVVFTDLKTHKEWKYESLFLKTYNKMMRIKCAKSFL